MGRVEDDAHEAARERAGDGDGEDLCEGKLVSERYSCSSSTSASARKAGGRRGREERAGGEGEGRTHPRTIQPMARQLIERRSPLQSATPMVEPVMHMVVETGRPYCDARMTVIEAPSSIEKPRDGEWSVILLPRTFML